MDKKTKEKKLQFIKHRVTDQQTYMKKQGEVNTQLLKINREQSDMIGWQEKDLAEQETNYQQNTDRLQQ